MPFDPTKPQANTPLEAAPCANPLAANGGQITVAARFGKGLFSVCPHKWFAWGLANAGWLRMLAAESKAGPGRGALLFETTVGKAGMAGVGVSTN